MGTDRRRFLFDMGAAAVGTALLSGRSAAANQAADSVSVALIGCGNQGEALAKRFKSTPHVRMSYVCDVDESRREKIRSLTDAKNSVDDLRRILDDKSVDAVVIATPDHWHTPAAILAMDAGKHVYVEKPCCQNFHEGVLLSTAVRCARSASFNTALSFVRIHWR